MKETGAPVTGLDIRIRRINSIVLLASIGWTGLIRKSEPVVSDTLEGTGGRQPGELQKIVARR